MVHYNNIVSGLLLMFFCCPCCVAINVNVQYNRGFLADIILLWTQCYLHRGTTCFDAMERFCICSLLIPPKRFDISPPKTGGYSEGLGLF